MKTPLQEVVEMLQDAAKKTESITAVPEVCLAVKSNGAIDFSVWGNGKYTYAETLEEALEKALAETPKKQKLDRAAEFRRQADQLEQEANAE